MNRHHPIFQAYMDGRIRASAVDLLRFLRKLGLKSAKEPNEAR